MARFKIKGEVATLSDRPDHNGGKSTFSVQYAKSGSSEWKELMAALENAGFERTENRSGAKHQHDVYRLGENQNFESARKVFKEYVAAKGGEKIPAIGEVAEGYERNDDSDLVGHRGGKFGRQ